MAEKDTNSGDQLEDIIEEKEQKLNIPQKLPILLLRDMVVFPYMIVPLFVGREKSKNAIDHSLSTHRMILLLTQKDMETEDPKREEVYEMGTVALIMRMLKLPDGRIRILAQGLIRAKVETFEEENGYLTAQISTIHEPDMTEKTLEGEALVRNVRGGLERATSLGKNIPPEVLIIATNVEEPGRLADLTAANLELKVAEAQEILEIKDPIGRLKKVHELLAKELEILDVQSRISTEAKGEMDKLQRQYFLRQQMKAIQKELGEGNELQEEIKGYQDSMKKLKVPDEVREELEKQISRLAQMHPESAETTVVRNYLDWMFALPWNKSTVDNLDLKKAKKILDEDHYGLEKVKERDPRIPGRPDPVEKNQRADPLLRRPPGRGEDVPRPVDRPVPRPRVRSNLARRGQRRGRDPGPPPDVRRCPPRPHHPEPPPGQLGQPGVHDGRGRQDRRGFPGRSVLGSPRSPGPRAEQFVPGSLSRRAVRPLQGHVHHHGESPRPHPARLPRPDGGHSASRLHRRGEAPDRAPAPRPEANHRERPDAEVHPVHERGDQTT